MDSREVGFLCGYFHTESYTQKAESGMLFNDEKIGIKWPLQVTNISDWDLKHKLITKEFKGLKIKWNADIVIQS